MKRSYSNSPFQLLQFINVFLVSRRHQIRTKRSNKDPISSVVSDEIKKGLNARSTRVEKHWTSTFVIILSHCTYRDALPVEIITINYYEKKKKKFSTGLAQSGLRLIKHSEPLSPFRRYVYFFFFLSFRGIRLSNPR